MPSQIKGFSYAPEVAPMPERPRASVFDGEIGPWSVMVARYQGHELHVDRRNDYFDKMDGYDGYRYLGHAQNRLDAFNRWKNYLYSIGIEPSGAKQVRK